MSPSLPPLLPCGPEPGLGIVADRTCHELRIARNEIPSDGKKRNSALPACLPECLTLPDRPIDDLVAVGPLELAPSFPFRAASGAASTFPTADRDGFQSEAIVHLNLGVN